MTVAGRIRDVSYRPKIAARSELYSRRVSAKERLELQLALWNTEWQRLTATVPYYRDLAARTGTRRGFESWTQFLATVPITSRGSVKADVAEMTDTSAPPEFYRVTGGTTSEPVRLPAWHSEYAHTRFDLWMARSWYGISPSSRQFMLWGHGHLLGHGFKGQMNALRRRVKDRLLGYSRSSAYDLHPLALQRAADTLIRFRPEYVAGFSVALDLFAREAGSLRSPLRALGIKVVIGSSEAFPAADSAALLEDLFAAPVAMEYGSVETDLIAHSRPEGGYWTSWRSYFIEASPDATRPGVHAIRVTSLYPRCFPLVRYEIGDEVALGSEPASQLYGLDSFERVVGRCNEFVPLRDGGRIHSSLFNDAVRLCQSIIGYQVVGGRHGEVAIHYMARHELSRAEVDALRERLARVHPELRTSEVRRVERLVQTIAGKTKMIVLTRSSEQR
jgi:phenylacetate-CoA ligase